MMASCSQSGSPLHHGDTSSDTDVVPGEGNTEGSFVVRLENVPTKWRWFNISTYIRKHTEHVDKEIINDITDIEMKLLYRENFHLHKESWIYFKTEQIRNQALLLLKGTGEKVKKQTLAAHSFDGIEKPNKALSSGYYLLQLVNVPLSWTYVDVKTYVKHHTVGKNAYAKDISYIKVMKSPIAKLQRSFIRFKTKCYRDEVYTLLKAKQEEQFNAKTLNVHKVDDWDLYFGSTPSNDGSNPTPPHTSAVPTSDKSAIQYKSTKGTLKIVNIPPNWMWKNVFNYIKRNTSLNKEIIGNINYIGIIRADKVCYVTFKTKELRTLALTALKISKETIHKKMRVFEVKESLQLEQIKFSIDPKSNLRYDGLNPSPFYGSGNSAISETSATNTMQDKEGQYYLTLNNVPLDWKYKDVLDYVKKHTESVDKTLTENISYIKMQKDSNSPQGYICFKTEYSRELAFEILSSTNEKVEGKKIFVRKVCAPRDRSRSPLRKESNTTIDWARPIPVHTSANTLPDTDKNLKNYSYLKLFNVPYSWRRCDVEDYIRRHTDCVDKKLAEDIAFIQLSTVSKPEMLELHCFIHFKTVQVRNRVYLLLTKTTEIVDGKIIQVITVKRPRLTGRIGVPTDMSMITDEDGMYGLSMDALKQLDIDLPLSTKVFVQFLPLDFDESQAYTLFSCAGIVEYISLEKKDYYSTATVEYEHPVHAVQAVSMFDKQKIFECKIKCNMLKYKTEMIKGFSTLGRGLGPNGTPLRNIRLTLERKELKEHLLAQHNEILKSANELEAQLESLIQANNTTLALKNTNPVMTNPIPILRNLLTNQMLLQTQSNNSEAFDTSLSNIGNSNMDQTQTNNQSGIEPMEVDTDIQSTNNVQASPNQNTTTQGSKAQLSVVQFKNLPPSITQPVLRTKMAAIGNVKFIQMYNGTALVNFNSHLDADKCYRLWNQSRQDGHIIEVKKI